MENSKASFSPTRLLLCYESKTSLDEKEVDLFISMDEAVDEEYIQILLDSEMRGFSQISTGDWIKEARLDAIQYILNKRDLLGFTFQTAYLSVIYLDRFLSRRTIDEEKYWAMKLLSMACLSLAAKMEECVVPALPEFCVEEYSFESSVIKRMELLVLNTLEWKMGSVTPFAFTHFFLTKFCQSSPQRNAITTIVQVILDALKDVEIMCYRSSVIAAAATLVALDPRLTRDALEQKISLISSNGVLKIVRKILYGILIRFIYFPSKIVIMVCTDQNVLDFLVAFVLFQEDVISCYFQILELDIMKLNKGIVSADLSPNQLQIAGVLGSSSVTTSAASAKRKRLIFNQNDHLSRKKQ
ncbi:cyclin-D5-1-like [Forsythia ovata]|uniref:Cyclin-D5-1-like n=1 Tax=Forsythia ovata TaxID=205694 RepID=A0ABD1RM97_9LAMI